MVGCGGVQLVGLHLKVVLTQESSSLLELGTSGRENLSPAKVPRCQSIIKYTKQKYMINTTIPKAFSLLFLVCLISRGKPDRGRNF